MRCSCGRVQKWGIPTSCINIRKLWFAHQSLAILMLDTVINHDLLGGIYTPLSGKHMYSVPVVSLRNSRGRPLRQAMSHLLSRLQYSIPLLGTWVLKKECANCEHVNIVNGLFPYLPQSAFVEIVFYPTCRLGLKRRDHQPAPWKTAKTTQVPGLLGQLRYWSGRSFGSPPWSLGLWPHCNQPWEVYGWILTFKVRINAWQYWHWTGFSALGNQINATRF